MNTISKSQLRSDMDWRRRRVDKLEYNTKKAIASLQQPDALNLSQLSFYHKYLAWCVQILDQLKRDTASVYEDYDYIELLIDAYKHELTNINNQEVITYYIKPITLLKQPTTGYDTFLQTGVTIYLKYIDIYQMWFTRNEVNALLINTEPDMSSYAFLALLACFTGLNNGMLTKQVYKINFKKAKECLAEAYANSSFKNIIGLFFLASISAYKSDLVSYTRYFSLAIRMAQLLGYDKSEKEMAEEDKRKLWYGKGVKKPETEFNEKKRAANLWDSLSLFYYTSLTMFPNMPSFNANFKPVKINLSSAKNSIQLNSSYSPTDLEISGIFSDNKFENIYSDKIVTESFTQIVSHIQKVKSEYSRLNKLHEIPHSELQLPNEKFNTAFTNLTSQLIYSKSISDTVKRMESNDQVRNMKRIQKYYQSNAFKYHLNAYAHLVMIYLYYPSVLVIPKPKKFPLNEAMILYKSVESLSEFFLIMKRYNIQQTHGKNRGAFACARCAMATNAGFHVKYDGPYYNSIMYIIYACLSFISEGEWLLNQGFGKKFILEAKGYVLKLLRLLKAACDSKLKSERCDSESTIEFIKINLDNYVVDKMFLTSINNVIG